MNFIRNFEAFVIWTPFVAALIFVLYLYLMRITNFWEVPGVEYVKSNLLFGNFYNVFVNKENFVLKMKSLYDASKDPFSGFYLLIKPVVLVRDLHVIMDMLLSDSDKFTDRGLLTSNLLLLKGERWRPITDKLPSNMLSDIQTRQHEILAKTSITLLKHIECAIKTNHILNVRELMGRFTTAAMTSIVFNTEIDAINSPDDMFCKMGRLIARSTRIGQLRSSLVMTMPNLAKVLRIRTIDPDIEKFLHKVINRALESRESGKVVAHDYLQLLVQLRNGGKFNEDGKWDIKSVDEKNKHLTIDEIVMQAFLFYAHEFDAALSAMSFGLFELARNKKILMAVQNEIDEVLRGISNPKDLGLFEYKRSPMLFRRMKYVDQVIHEILRKYPANPIVVRSPLKPYKLPQTEIILDVNQEIFIPVHAIHHNPEYFTRPNDFDPVRFHPDNFKRLITGTYYPFGDSSNDWISSGFTFLQIKMGIVAFCLKFNFELASECSRDFKFCNTLNVIDNLKLHVTLRNE